MTFIYLPEAVSLPVEFEEPEPLDMSNLPGIRKQFSLAELGMGCWTMRQSGVMFAPLVPIIQNVGDLLKDWLQSVTDSESQPDSHASLSAWQVIENQTMTCETDGLTPFALLEKSNRDESTLKTSEDCFPQWIKPQMSLFPTLGLWSDSWPKAGMVSNGASYLLPMLVPHINGKESGFGRSWKSPVASEAEGGAKKNLYGDNTRFKLRDQVLPSNSHYWPTPAKNPPGFKNIEIVDKDGNKPESSNQRWYDAESGRLVQKGLEQVIKWATPNTLDGMKPKSPESLRHEMDESRPGRSRPANLISQVSQSHLWPTPNKSDRSGGRLQKRKTGEGANLRDAVKQMEWPTPRKSEHKGVGPIGSKSHAHMLDRGYLVASVQHVGNQSGLLNPDWVEWLMGWPIGWTSLDPLPEQNYQLWIDGMINRDWWNVDPADVGYLSRLCEGYKGRADRVKVLGNGQVPATAHEAWRQLNDV